MELSDLDPLLLRKKNPEEWLEDSRWLSFMSLFRKKQSQVLNLGQL